MPSQPDNLDAESLPNYPVRPGEPGSAQAGKPGPPLPAEGIEFSDVLETSTPLEARRVRYVIAPTQRAARPPVQPAPVQPVPVERSQSYVQPPHVQPVSEPVFPTELLRDEPVREPTIPAPATSNYVQEQVHVQELVVPLLDERLVVDKRRRKVGEVVVRKEIETHIVEVPIRREKLIVEQVSPQYEQLAVVELGPAQMANSAVSAMDEANQPPSVSGSFASAAEAMQFLAAIAAEPNAGLHNVQIKVVLENASQQALYQRLLAQYSAKVRR